MRLKAWRGGLFLFSLGASGALTRAQELPDVSSAALVVHFRAEPESVNVDASGRVLSWESRAGLAISLESMGSNPDRLRYEPEGMHGRPVIVLEDDDGQHHALRAYVNAGLGMQNATIFWLGHYVTDEQTHGRFAYSFSSSLSGPGSTITHITDGGAGTQYLHMFDGQTTFTGDAISNLEGETTVWRTVHRDDTAPAHHSAFANRADLHVGASSAGYDLGDDWVILHVGGWGTNGWSMIGQIAELIIYDGELTPSDLRAVEGYLFSRFTTGSSTCSSGPNSTGAAARIWATGSASVATNELVLHAAPLPSQPGVFFYGQAQAPVPFGNGLRCVGGPFGRLGVFTPGAGTAHFALDLRQPPSPALRITPGSSWTFQAWYRDLAAGGAGFDLSDALSVTFEP